MRFCPVHVVVKGLVAPGLKEGRNPEDPVLKERERRDFDPFMRNALELDPGLEEAVARGDGG